MKKLFLLLLLPTLGWCDTKISALTEITSIGESDIIPVVIDPSGTPANRKIKRSNLIRTTDYIQNTGAPTIATQKFSVSSGTVLELAVTTPTWGTSGFSNAYYLTPSNYLWRVNGVGFPADIQFGPGNGGNTGDANIIFGTDNMTSATSACLYNNVFGTGNLVSCNGGLGNFVQGLFNGRASVNGSFNFLMGDHVLQNGATSPQNNTLLGSSIGVYVPIVNNNQMIGQFIGSGTDTASFLDSTIVGNSAYNGARTLLYDVAVGNYVMINGSDTSHITSVGTWSGSTLGTSTPTVHGSDLSFYGYNSGQSGVGTLTNATAIGANAKVRASNSVQIGGASGSGSEQMLYVASATIEGTLSLTGPGDGEGILTVAGSTYTVIGSSAMPAVGSYLVVGSTWGHVQAGVNLTVPGFLNIPNGTAPTVDAVGKMALDTTNGELLLHDGTAAKVVATSTHSFTISIATAGWNGQSIVVWRAPNDMAVTINKVLMETMQAGTTVLFNLSEVNFGATASAGVDVFTVAFDSATNSGNTRIGGFANASIAATASLIFKTPTAGAAGGAPQVVTFTVYYEKTRT